MKKTSPKTDAATVHHTRSEWETIRIARRLASHLDGGSTILLFGDLGAGKTAFVRGIVEGVGGESDDVSSPTFTVIQPYRGRLTIHHVDLYRLRSADVDDLGLDELSTPSSILAIEWADRLPRRPTSSVCVYIEDRGGDEREIRIEGGPDA